MPKKYIPVLLAIGCLFSQAFAAGVKNFPTEEYVIFYFEDGITGESISHLEDNGCHIMQKDSEKNAIFVSGDNCLECFELRPPRVSKIVYVNGDERIVKSNPNIQEQYNSTNYLQVFFSFIQ